MAINRSSFAFRRTSASDPIRLCAGGEAAECERANPACARHSPPLSRHDDAVRPDLSLRRADERTRVSCILAGSSAQPRPGSSMPSTCKSIRIVRIPPWRISMRCVTESLFTALLLPLFEQTLCPLFPAFLVTFLAKSCTKAAPNFCILCLEYFDFFVLLPVFLYKKEKLYA